MTTAVGVDFRKELGDELLTLVRHLASPLTDVTPLAGPGYPGYEPSCFRLRLADGRVFKGRRCATAAEAALIEDVLQHIRCDNFPAVVARAGLALVTEWFDGQCLDSAGWVPELLARCGALQGRIHTVPLPADSPAWQLDHVAAHCTRLRENLAHLVSGKVMDSGEAQAVLALATQATPHHCTLGYVHRDFCSENLVVQPSGEIGVIDNGAVGIDAHDYDLGRTWYRWPMQAPQREAYLDGYRQYRQADTFIEYFAFWTVSAVVNGAAFRLEKSGDDAAFPLTRLRALVGLLEGGLSLEQAVLRW
jgi:hypothetical protein